MLDATGAALCVPGSGQARYSLGNGNDVMRYLAPHAARVDLGADDDTYHGAGRDDSIGANGLVVQDADVIGGTGSDLITYANAPAVRLSLENQFNDGNRGKENIRSDFERIVGSKGNDVLIGSDDPNKPESFAGGLGNDTMQGLGGMDIFNEGPVPKGGPDRRRRDHGAHPDPLGRPRPVHPARRAAAPRGRHPGRRADRLRGHRPRHPLGGAGSGRRGSRGVRQPSRTSPSSTRRGPLTVTVPRTTTSAPNVTSPSTDNRSQATSDGAPSGKRASKSRRSL